MDRVIPGYEDFIKSTLCQDDNLLYTYYIEDDITNFRKRLGQKFSSEDVQKNISKVVSSIITDYCRDIIYNTIGNLTRKFHPMGDMVVSGGDAFNLYMNYKYRMISPDIDTKFVPVFKSKNGAIITPASQYYFGYLQVFKILMWDTLGKLCQGTLDKKISDRIHKYISQTKIGKLLGIKLPSKGPTTTRRYHLIRKKKQSKGVSVTENDILIDVELFAVDAHLSMFDVTKKRITQTTIGGIIDIAIMRPGEIGYEVVFSKRTSGISYKNPITGRLITNRNIQVAGRRFLMEDLYIMQDLNLRPKKREKDKKRMYLFAKHVLNLNVKTTDSITTLFLKSLPVIHNSPVRDITKRPVFSGKYVKEATKVNPYRYEKYTSKPVKGTVISKFLVGDIVPRTGYTRTSSEFKFDTSTKKWKVASNPYYIKNEYTYRPSDNITPTPPRNLKSWEILYGYNPIRNSWIPPKIIKTSAEIQLVGLKNMRVSK